MPDRKSTRLNSSHLVISYAVFCLTSCLSSHSPLLPYTTLFRSQENFRQYVTLTGFDELQERLTRESRGAVFLGVHLGNWEWGSLAVGFLGFDTAVVAEKFKNARSEEHTSELQSPCNLVCRLLLDLLLIFSFSTLALHDALPISGKFSSIRHADWF